MNDQRHTLSILFLQETNGWWVALWLETNMAGQARNIKDAWLSLRNSIRGQLLLDRKRGRTPLSGKRRSPEWYWEAYKNAQPLSEGFLDMGDVDGNQDLTAFEPRQLAAA